MVRIAMEPASKRKKKNSVETNSSENAIHSRDTPLMLFSVEDYFGYIVRPECFIALKKFWLNCQKIYEIF